MFEPGLPRLSRYAWLSPVKPKGSPFALFNLTRSLALPKHQLNICLSVWRRICDTPVPSTREMLKEGSAVTLARPSFRKFWDFSNPRWPFRCNNCGRKSNNCFQELPSKYPTPLGWPCGNFSTMRPPAGYDRVLLRGTKRVPAQGYCLCVVSSLNGFGHTNLKQALEPLQHSKILARPQMPHEQCRASWNLPLLAAFLATQLARNEWENWINQHLIDQV